MRKIVLLFIVFNIIFLNSCYYNKITRKESETNMNKNLQQITTSKDILEKMLLEEKFDFKNPNCELALKVYKEFCVITFNAEEDDILFQTGVYDFSGENLFHWDFTRQFYVEPEDLNDEGLSQLNFTIYFKPDEKLKKLNTSVWSMDFSDLNSFFEKVEKLEEFKYPYENLKPVKAELNYSKV